MIKGLSLSTVDASVHSSASLSRVVSATMRRLTDAASVFVSPPTQRSLAKAGRFIDRNRLWKALPTEVSKNDRSRLVTNDPLALRTKLSDATQQGRRKVVFLGVGAIPLEVFARARHQEDTFVVGIEGDDIHFGSQVIPYSERALPNVLLFEGLHGAAFSGIEDDSLDEICTLCPNGSLLATFAHPDWEDHQTFLRTLKPGGRLVIIAGPEMRHMFPNVRRGLETNYQLVESGKVDESDPEKFSEMHGPHSLQVHLTRSKTLHYLIFESKV